MANLYEKALSLDVSGRDSNQYIPAKQGDKNSRKLIISLTHDGNPYTVENGNSIEFRCKKPSGYVCDNPAILNADGTITATLTEQCLAEPGLVKADVAIRDKVGNVLSTATFWIDTREAGSNGRDIKSNNELLILNELIAEAKEAVVVVSDLADRADAVLVAINASKDAAAKSASDAAASKKGAEDAKADAQAAMRAAESAKSGAISAKNAAADSAAAAAGSAQAAANSATEADGSASSAATHKTAAEQAKTAAQTAASDASAAKNAAVTAQGKAEAAQGKAEQAESDAVSAKNAAASSSSAAAAAKTGAESAASNASGSASSAADSAAAAAGSAQAAANSATAAAASAKAAATEVAAVVGTVPKKPDGSDQTVVEYIDNSIREITAPRFGVSGVGGASATLTRLWDSVGKTVTVSTDTVVGSSGFDSYAPFNRKKCVGHWTKHNGKAKFNIAAYFGDADYAEDGSMGDYVAVEVKPFYYYEKDGILGVSEQQYPGWKIHPVCVDYDGNIRENTYLPVYALAKNEAGNAVSLPGLYNLNGAYKTLWDYCKSYADADAGSLAILEPSAVNHYEWLLMVIEFGTQNIQSYMMGCAGGLPHGDSYTAVATPASNKVVVGSWGSGLVVGQTITFTTNIWDVNGPSSYNVITALQKCNADGTLNSSGSYWLITYDGTNRTATPGTTKVVSRPWRTGCCTGALAGINAVKGHTGYPISNNGKYPCMYRFREITYGNQYNTSLDMADTRIADGDSVHLEWYFLADPRKYTPASTSSPSAADLDGADTGWVKLNVITPVPSYANGYIKEFDVDEMFPHVKVPVNTVGGSSSSYYCDAAYLVGAHAVRSVRRGGALSDGVAAGPCCMSANYAPSVGSWSCGGALHFIQ